MGGHGGFAGGSGGRRSEWVEQLAAEEMLLRECAGGSDTRATESVTDDEASGPAVGLTVDAPAGGPPSSVRAAAAGPSSARVRGWAAGAQESVDELLHALF